MKIAPSATLSISAKANEMKKNGESVISFSVGEPDFKTPAFIINACKEALDKGLTKYTPVGGTAQLKNAVCAKFLRDNGLAYTPDEIVVSDGAKSSLFHALYAIINPGDEVIIPAPYWLTYPEAVGICGGKPIFVKTKAKNGYKITAKELEAAITERTKCVILNTPCNPTGSVYDKNELEALAEVIVKNDIFVISDEVYEKLIFGKEHVSIASLNAGIKRLAIVINAVSKSYAMTGWRIGYLACNKKLAKVITSLQSHTTSNATSFCQYAAAVALNLGEESVSEMATVFAHRRKLILKLLGEIPDISFAEPEGAFYVFVNVSKYYGKVHNGKKISGSVEFCEALLTAGVAAVPGKPFGSDDCVRLSYATLEENIMEGLERFKTFLLDLK